MYKCSECGRIFDEPREESEYSEFWGVGGYTKKAVSPCCGEAYDDYYAESDTITMTTTADFAQFARELVGVRL